MKKTTFVLLLALPFTSAHAITAIQPFLEFGPGENIDGFQDDFSGSDYTSDVSFGGANRDGFSEVDLEAGTLRPRLSVNGSNVGGRAGAQLVDTLTFTSTGDSAFNFRIETGGFFQVNPNGFTPEDGDNWDASLPQIGVESTLSFYPGGSITGITTDGVEATASPLFTFEDIAGSGGFLDRGASFVWQDFYIDGFFGIFQDDTVTIPLVDGVSTFDIYASLILSADTRDSGSVDLDFTNTLALGINSPQPFTSRSGAFLDSQTITVAAVPEPSTVWSLSIAGLLGFLRRRR